MEENKNTENTFESDSSKKKSESKKAMNGM